MTEHDMIIAFIKSVLDDDNGISERSYNIIVNWFSKEIASDDDNHATDALVIEINKIMMGVKATDGRYYTQG